MAEVTDVASAAEAASAPAAANRNMLWLIYFLVIVYAICQQLQLPLEPFIVDKLVGKGSASSTIYGRLRTTFMVVQTIGSFVCGMLLDKYGVRTGLILNFLANALAYTLLANATSLPVLFLSKIPAVFAFAYMCSVTAVSHITPAGEERIAALGRLSTAYSIGGIMGPAVGGRLGAAGDYFTSAWVAVVGSLFAAALCFLLPAGVGKQEKGAPPAEYVAAESTTAGESFVSAPEAAAAAEVQAPAEAERLPYGQRCRIIFGLVGHIIFAKLVLSTASSIVYSAQSLILKNQMRFTEADLGNYMSGMFAFHAFINALFLKTICRLLGGEVRFVVANACMGIGMSYFALSWVMRPLSLGDAVAAFGDQVAEPAPGVFTQPRTWMFVGVVLTMTVFSCSLWTSMTSESTKRVPSEMKGTLIGLESGILSAFRIMTPTLGIAIFNSAGSSFLYGSCSVVYIAVFIAWSIANRSPRAPKEVDPPKELEIALAS